MDKKIKINKQRLILISVILVLLVVIITIIVKTVSDRNQSKYMHSKTRFKIYMKTAKKMIYC